MLTFDIHRPSEMAPWCSVSVRNPHEIHAPLDVSSACAAMPALGVSLFYLPATRQHRRRLFIIVARGRLVLPKSVVLLSHRRDDLWRMSNQTDDSTRK